MLRLLKCLLLVFLVSCSVTMAAPAKPQFIPCGPKAYTQAKFNLSRLPVCERTIISAYDKYGKHDAKWDDQAKRFLHSYVDLIVGKRTSKDAPGLAQMGKAAVQAGCDDALVLDSYAMALYMAGKIGEAEGILPVAVTNFSSSHYPKFRCALATAHLYGILSRDLMLTPERKAQLREQLIKQTVEAIDEGTFRHGEDRIAADFIENNVASCFDADGGHGDLYSAILKCRGLSPWLAKYIKGCYEIDLAWKSRGCGWASTVTEDGWKGFEQHLSAANRVLHEAWKIHPDYPEAAAMMIKVAMGECANEGETPRLWFKRAVTAQMDYAPAYAAYAWAIRPRWGGSLREMEELGIECLKTRRFDTEAPWQYYSQISSITSELDGDKRYLKKSETWTRMQVLLDGYGKANNPWALSADQCASAKAGIAAMSERFPEAKKILDSLGGRLDNNVFAQYYPDGAKYVHIWGGPFGEALKTAAKLDDSEAYGQALAVYKDLEGKAAGDKYAAPYVRDRIEAIGLAKAFAEGKWAELHPRFDSDDWMVHGNWKTVDGGAIEGRVGSNGFSVLSNVSFGDRYEIRGEFEFVSGKDEPQNAGVILNSSNSIREVLFYRDGDKCVAENGADKKVVEKVGVQEKNTFLVQHWDDNVTVYLNGKLIQNAVELKRYLPIDHKPRVGVVCNMTKPASVIRFRDLQVRRLTEAPGG